MGIPRKNVYWIVAGSFALAASLVTSNACAQETGPQASGSDESGFTLLYRRDVHEALKLDDTQCGLLKQLQEYLHDETKKLIEAAGRNGGSSEEIQRQLAELQRSCLKDAGRILDLDQVLKLRRIQWQSHGAQAAFTPRLRQELHITAAQASAFQRAADSSAEQLFADYKQHAQGRPRSDQMRIMTERQKLRRADLERVILQDILDPEQRALFAAALGERIPITIEPENAELLLQRCERRAAPPPRILEPYALAELIQLPSVRAALQMDSVQERKLLEAANEWVAEEDRFYKTLAGLPETQRWTKLRAHSREYQEKILRFDRRIESIVGPAGFRRLRELRFQVHGPGALLGYELVRELRLTGDQLKKMRTVIGQRNQELAERLLKDADAEQASSLAEDARRAWEIAVVEVLTPEQRSAWSQKLGAPIDTHVRRTIELDVQKRTAALAGRIGR